MQRIFNRILGKQVPRSDPILIYQMGKVGSSSIKATLDRLNLFESYQVHRLNLDNIARVRREHEIRGWPIPPRDVDGIEVYDRMIKPRVRLKIITLVREPIGRNFSYYFQNLNKIFGVKDAQASIPVERLVREFPVAFSYSDNPLTWFEYEFREVTGIDLYACQLDMGNGFARVVTDLYDVLILRTDIADEIKSEALANFLGVRRIPLARVNDTANKAEGRTYFNFRDSIQMVPAYLDLMLGSKYSQRFFDKGTLSRLRDQYTQTGFIIPDAFLEFQRGTIKYEGQKPS